VSGHAYTVVTDPATGALTAERAAEDASVSFRGGSDTVPVILPAGVRALHVFSGYSSGAAGTLMIQAPGGAASAVSGTAASPTDVSAWAGQPVILSVTGAGADDVTAFGLRLGW
jgi:hypothetical protein